MGLLDLGGYFLPHFREFFNYYLLKYFLMAFLFVFFFWDSYYLNVGAFDIVPEVSEVILISLILFSSLLHLFPPFYLPPHLSALLYQLFYCQFLPECFYSVIALFIIDQLFFISSENEVAQSCLILCDPMDCSLSGSSVHGIFQAIVLEWIAISFSRASSQPRD